MANNEPRAMAQIQPQNMRALVMTAPWSFNDTEQSVDAFFRNKIPDKYKKNGIFELGTGAEGLFVDQKGAWGRALFFREDKQFPVLIPMNRVKVGAKWRPLDAKLRDSRRIDAAINEHPPSLSINAPTRLETHVRAFWLSLREKRTEMRRHGLRHSEEQQMFGETFSNNVDLIVSGFTRQARQLFSNGITDVNQLASLPMASQQWPPRGAKVIYVRLYRRRAEGRLPAVYVGQTINPAFKRHMEHEAAIGSNNPHYNAARQSAPQDRLMIPIMVWDEGQHVSAGVLNMAEQTMMLMLGTYHVLVRTPGTHEHLFNHFTLLDAVNTSTRQISGWPANNGTGTNVISPVFDFHRSPPIHCYRERTEATGLPAMTVFRQARIVRQSIRENGGYQFGFSLQRSGGTTERFGVAFPPGDIPAEIPGYLVFEIMHGGRPHASAYLGCPTIGPFENFGIANSLAIAFEWWDEASDQWEKCYTRRGMFRSAFARGLANSDPAKALGPWKRCVEFIQLLEGIDYTGNLDFFSRSLFPSPEVHELVLDHLSQKASWRPRPRQSQPAPKRATFADNAQRMANLTSAWSTVTNLATPPPLTSDFWRRDESDTRSASKLSQVTCDFCKYMFDPHDRHRLRCERDTRFTDQWVCKCCALLNRPCSWTSRSQNIEYWGQGPPYLGVSTFVLGTCPTGPHRWLAFHQAFPENAKVIDTVEPIDGLDGLIILQDVLDDDDESSSLEDHENEADD
uniref:GIY-YIG domain-containing protein n=1 Tax=Gibberella zeae TaxID=5518 RepID=A0A4E9EDN7_GIBZA